MSLRAPAFGLLVFLSCGPLAAQSPPPPAANAIGAPQLLAALKLAPRDNREREAVLRDQFAAHGCHGPAITEFPVRHEPAPDLICTLPGSGAGVIIVSAHSDHVRQGMGIVDNWSGSILLPRLYEVLAAAPRHHTYRFIVFSGEEDGLVGSRAYVHSLTPAQLAAIRADINLDTLALGPTKIWLTHSDRALAFALGQVASDMKIPLGVVNADSVGDEDGTSFRTHNVPTLMLHSITQPTLSILHSPRDTINAVQIEDYFDSYRLLCAYLTALDNQLP